MRPKDREKALHHIAALSRAEKEAPNADVARVREDLESQLGGTVPRSLAATVLGVSHTALNNWTSTGDVPTVITGRGRKEIPIPTLIDLWERVEQERKAGKRKRHVLEPAITEARRRAKGMRPRMSGPDSRPRTEPHRAAELRGLLYHRALAPRLRRPMIDAAQRKMRRWRQEGRLDPRHADAWEEVFAMPMAEIRKAISTDDERGRNLRQNSPLAGLISEPERRKILEQAR
jgi:hypothetical protein